MRYKFQVIPAFSGQDGLNRLTEHPDVNLLIVDLAMPRMSGLQFIRKVKEQERLKEIAIIVVTSRGGEADEEEARTFAQGSVRKPFTSNELHALIEKHAFINLA